jgi:hypothetical protein
MNWNSRHAAVVAGKDKGALNSAMQPTNPFGRLRAPLRGKVIARAVFLIIVAALLAAVAAAFGIARDYGYLRASILTALPEDNITCWQRASPSGPDASTAPSR